MPLLRRNLGDQHWMCIPTTIFAISVTISVSMFRLITNRQTQKVKNLFLAVQPTVLLVFARSRPRSALTPLQ